MTSFLGVPIRLRGVAYGNLYLTDKAGGRPFTEVDQELAVGLAAAAGLAIENARLHEQARTAGLLDEREQIARDLHDDVIQRLFATGLSLQAAAQLAADPTVEERISRAVDELNRSIRQIRSTIFELQQRRSSQPSLRSDIVAICAEYAAALGFEPTCDIAGPIDSTVAEPTRGHLLLCLREALSNVARHARATSVQVDIHVHQGRLGLRVADDGIGHQVTPGGHSSGLDNMRVRAGALRGTFALEERPTGGTQIAWDVPLTDEATSAPR